MVNVCLFDLTGRQVAALFNDQSPFGNLALPLNRVVIPTGVYVERVSVENKVLFKTKVVNDRITRQ
jgi:hypothetical protein